VTIDLTGTWRLAAWRRVSDDGSVSYPLGENARGLLVYSPDGRMMVQMAAADRPRIEGTDPLGGDVGARAEAYSTCLAYFGSWEVEGDQVRHRVDSSLYPNWSGAEQARPFTYDGHELVLRTPPAGGVVNEMAWTREEA